MTTKIGESMSRPEHYSKFFANLLSWQPHAWQEHLAAADDCDNRLIRIPPGMGKTEGVLAAWLFHAVARRRSAWPRRLVWCLPMRVLVEQTAARCRQVIDRWANSEGIAEADRPRVHILMGGEDTDRWWLHPERPAVLIGTQDMLLSRALNRGYASARARWPMEYALLNQDALWVMDEVQLMDV
ncbi:MAG: DEAD/DEAH box helicase, partial [Planctomycetota bacterium]